MRKITSMIFDGKPVTRFGIDGGTVYEEDTAELYMETLYGSIWTRTDFATIDDLKSWFASNKSNTQHKILGNKNVIPPNYDATSFFQSSSSYSFNMENFDITNIVNMNSMFKGCGNATVIYNSSWDTSNVTDMSNMFNGMVKLTGLYVNNWNTSKVINMSGMFYGLRTSSVRNTIDLSKWDTSNVTDTSNMFNGFTYLKDPKIQSFNMSKVTAAKTYRMFYNCNQLNTTLYAKDQATADFFNNNRSNNSLKSSSVFIPVEITNTPEETSLVNSIESVMDIGIAPTGYLEDNNSILTNMGVA